jgi:hypothetical protein
VHGDADRADCLLQRAQAGGQQRFLVVGALLCWRSVRLAQQRLESDGSEIFARVRVPAS